MHGGDSVVGVLSILRIRIRCASCERVSIQAVIFQMDVYIGVEEVASPLRKKKKRIFFFCKYQICCCGAAVAVPCPASGSLAVSDRGFDFGWECGWEMWVWDMGSIGGKHDQRPGGRDGAGLWRLRGWVL